MIESVLTRKNASLKLKLTLKALICVGIIALVVLLPQLAHLAVGEAAGVTLLPMYLPVLLGGCLLGSRWGVSIGLASPLISFLITASFGSPMPAAARLPFMMAELAVFAFVSGLFADKIGKHSWLAFPAIILAGICGRAFFLLLIAIFGSMTPFTTAMIWQQIKAGFVGFAIQAVVVPVTVMLLSALLNKEKSHD